jgi:hypothetical protein
MGTEAIWFRRPTCAPIPVMSDQYFTAQVAATLRRAFGLKSPMNVWDKSMTEPSTWDLMRYEAQRDMEFLEGDSWGNTGNTVNIRKPARFVS